MRGFDAASKIVGESVGVHGSAIANDPVLRRLSLCVDDVLPALSRACRMYGDGAAMHAMIALTASMARDHGLEETIAEAFRVNATMLDNRPLRKAPRPEFVNNRTLSLPELGAWFQRRLADFLSYGARSRQAAQVSPSTSFMEQHNDGDNQILFSATKAADAGAPPSGAVR